MMAAAALIFGPAFSQDVQNLPVPLEIQKAYASGTRSTDGKPGAKYWQNHSCKTHSKACN